MYCVLPLPHLSYKTHIWLVSENCWNKFNAKNAGCLRITNRTNNKNNLLIPLLSPTKYLNHSFSFCFQNYFSFSSFIWVYSQWSKRHHNKISLYFCWIRGLFLHFHRLLVCGRYWFLVPAFDSKYLIFWNWVTLIFNSIPPTPICYLQIPNTYLFFLVDHFSVIICMHMFSIFPIFVRHDRIFNLFRVVNKLFRGLRLVLIKFIPFGSLIILLSINSNYYPSKLDLKIFKKIFEICSRDPWAYDFLLKFCYM